MFEGKILQTGPIDGTADGAAAKDDLRALSWAELSGRLTAARDFRRLMAQGGQGDACSFNAASARHIALLGVALGDGKPGINPIALSDGKMMDSMDFATHEAARDDRGSE